MILRRLEVDFETYKNQLRNPQEILEEQVSNENEK